jgi:hypothetical protein
MIRPSHFEPPTEPIPNVNAAVHEHNEQDIEQLYSLLELGSSINGVFDRNAGSISRGDDGSETLRLYVRHSGVRNDQVTVVRHRTGTAAEVVDINYYDADDVYKSDWRFTGGPDGTPKLELAKRHPVFEDRVGYQDYTPHVRAQALWKGLLDESSPKKASIIARAARVTTAHFGGGKFQYDPASETWCEPDPAEEQRLTDEMHDARVEAHYMLGKEITDAFMTHANDVETAQDGSRRLRMQMQWRDRMAALELVTGTANQRGGSRMTFSAPGAWNSSHEHRPDGWQGNPEAYEDRAVDYAAARQDYLWVQNLRSAGERQPGLADRLRSMIGGAAIAPQAER